jgi:hypothetical protein
VQKSIEMKKAAEVVAEESRLEVEALRSELQSFTTRETKVLANSAHAWLHARRLRSPVVEGFMTKSAGSGEKAWRLKGPRVHHNHKSLLLL